MRLKGRVGWWQAEMEKADSWACKSSQTGLLPSSHVGSKRQTEKSLLGPKAFREGKIEFDLWQGGGEGEMGDLEGGLGF